MYMNCNIQLWLVMTHLFFCQLRSHFEGLFINFSAALHLFVHIYFCSDEFNVCVDLFRLNFEISKFGFNSDFRIEIWLKNSRIFRPKFNPTISAWRSVSVVFFLAADWSWSNVALLINKIVNLKLIGCSISDQI